MNVLLLILAVFAGSFLARCSEFFLLPTLMHLRGEKCPQCGKRHRQRSIMLAAPCNQCYEEQKKSMKIMQSVDCHPSITTMMQEVYSDPETVKAIRRGLGLQSERERFSEEEASE